MTGVHRCQALPYTGSDSSALSRTPRVRACSSFKTIPEYGYCHLQIIVF